MHRFFISPEAIEGNRIVLKGDAAHQVKDVLRLREGDQITVLDNSGQEFRVTLAEVGRDLVVGEVTGSSAARGEPQTRITLYQALLKGPKFELVLQKATELGVSSFVPVVTDRCVVTDSISEMKVSRWRKIVTEAAEQSRRGKLPEVFPVVSFAEACRSASNYALIPWEEEGSVSIGEILGKWSSRSTSGQPLSPSIFIGPEGGFAPAEVEMAKRYGILPVTLGPRILRAETAALAAIAVVLYHFGEMGR